MDRELPYSLDPDEFFKQQRLVEVTQSSLRLFMECEQKFVFQYMYRIRRRRLKVYLVIGHAVHAAFEVLLAPTIDGKEVPLDDRLPYCQHAIDRIFDKVQDGSDLMGTVGVDDLEVGRAQSYAIMTGWFNHFIEEMRGWDLQETEFKVRVREGVTLESPLLDRMAGMIDGIVLDKKDNENWILEHKTRGSLYNLNLLGLDLDFQALFYLILTRKVLQSRNIQIKPPVGFLYNAMQKPQHRMNKHGFPDLVARMTDAVTANPEKYFSFSPLRIPDSAVETALENLHRIVKKLDAMERDTIVMNTTACDNYGGCEFRSLCQAGARAGDGPEALFNLAQTGMFDITPLHPELEETSD